MSSSIDERIVEMAFKGAGFATGVAGAVKSLENLKSGLNSLKGSEGEINNLDEAGRRFSLKGMASGIEGLAGKFTHLGVVGVSAIATITNRAVNAGISIVKSLTIDPIKAGLDTYQTKINAIQTILANTSAAGTTLKQVTAALNQLNIYANKTVYNFGQMAKNIGTFTAAGVGLKTSVSAIKGIANLAALSGSSADQASNAMTQLSQAIAAGTVKLQDWNSVNNAGLGGHVFQNAILQTARVNGVAVDAMLKKYGSFRNALQSGFLTSKILTQSLSLFTGDLTNKQLLAMGFTEKESEAIQKQATLAVHSATQVRTVSALFQDLKEEVATAWGAVFQAIIGNIHQATTTLSGLHTTLENFFTKPIYAFAKILQQFRDLGGMAVLVQGLGNAFHALGAIIGVIKEAFHEVFPPSGTGTTTALINMATAFDNFTKALIPSKQTLSELKTIFVGLFSAVKIVIDVIKALVDGIFQIGGASKSAGGGFLAFIAKIASFITGIRKAIESGTALQTFFRTLGKVIAFPIEFIGHFLGALGGMGGALNKATGGLQGFIQKIEDLFKNVATLIGKGLQNGNFSAVASLLNHLLVGSILVVIRNFLKGFGQASGGGAGIFAGIKESLEGLVNTFKVMQDSLKADILEKIGIAIGVLAVSLLLLSFIPFPALTKSLGAVTIMFTNLLAALAVMTKISGAIGIVRMVAIGVALNLLAGAILILSGAVAILAQFSWEQIAKGLSAITVLLGELVATTALMTTDAPGVVATSVALNLLAVAINIMALAVGHLGKMNIGELVKGIGAIAALLLILGAFTKFSGKGLISTAASMVILGVALNVIARAVESLGKLSVGTLVKGLVSIAAVLVIIAAAMDLMPPSMIVTAAGLLVVSAALVVLSKALTAMGGMSWVAIAKSLIVLAGSLTIIAAAMLVMVEALPGAAALIVVAASLAILTPVLIALGGMSWEAIAKGLVALAGTFLVLGAAGLVLTPLIPSLLGLGAALLLLGVGVLAAGAGIALLGVGITALSVAVAAGGAAMISFMGNVLGLLPLAAKKFGEAIVNLADAVGNGGKAITKAFVTVLTSLLDGIIKVVPLASKAFGKIMSAVLDNVNKYSPKIIKTFLNLLQNLLDGLDKHMPRFVSKGIDIVVSLLNGISKNLNRVVNAGTNLVVNLVNGIGNSIQRVVRAGVNMVINLVNGVANQIRSSSPRIHAAAENLAGAIISGMIAGITGGLSGVIGAAVHMATSALDAAKRVLHINSPSKAFQEIGASIPEGTALGIKDNTSLATDGVRTMGSAMLDTLSQTLSGLASTSIDIRPKITPVVDLTMAKKGFNDLADLTKSQLLAATHSSTSALSISAANAQAAKVAGLVSSTGDQVTFNQYNTSPRALSSTEIYRRTKNQISIAKGVLTGHANVG